MVDKMDAVVIGAGVVGLAVARALALAGREVLVLEAQGAIGTGASSRNSEVIHAGIYYPQGSLKAALCVQGKALLYAYCAERGIAHQRCGKLIVATAEAQRDALSSIARHAAANGVDDLQLLTREAAQALEPALACVAALHSPSTGIVDSHALMLSLQGDLENAGGLVALNSPLASAQCQANIGGTQGILLTTQDGTQLLAQTVVNAAGLWAPEVARHFQGLAAQHIPTAYYAKGNYFSLNGRAPFRHLIYPVPEAAGLGVHLSLDLGGQAKFGPDVQWVQGADDLVVDPQRGEAFYAEVRRYWPGLQDGQLAAGYAGIRAKISGPGAPAADFCIQTQDVHAVPGLVNLFGIESPGLTSCMAIGQAVAHRLA